jgi:hydroxymethylpyrimidine/phosphomethylpyrimidine kinase
MQTILTIAGFDPSGGAGVLADCKTFAAFGCFGAAAITSLTSQNTRGVFATFHQSAEILRAQLVPILDDYDIAAVKIGMLPTVELIEVVIEILAQRNLKNIVLDPVWQSSSGFALMDDAAQTLLLEKLMPLTDVVTPNLDEVAVLSGRRPTTVAEMQVAAQQLSAQFSQHKSVAVLVKGGHLQNEATDVLFDGIALHNFPAARLSSRHTHGTGCTLSSAMAALLAQSCELTEAVERAKNYVTEAIMNAPQLGHGAGPMHHFYHYAAKSPYL